MRGAGLQVAKRGGRDAALQALVKDRGFAEPEEIAAAVLFLASDDARLLGQTSRWTLALRSPD